MQPCRKHPSSTTDLASEHVEELILYTLLVAIGVIPVVMAIVHHGAFGSEATVGGLMIGAGALGALALAIRAAATRRS